MNQFWQHAAAHLRANRRVLLVLVAENTRHSPGTVGARLLIAEDGDTLGTIGGGVMEHGLIERSREILQGSGAFVELRELHHRRSPRGEASGMICAGSQTNLAFLCRPEAELAVIEGVAARVADGRSGTLRISPEGMTLDDEEPDVDQLPRRLVRDGAEWRYEEELLNRRRLAILGGGHCALALARVMTRLGYDVFAFEAEKKRPEVELERVVRRLEVVPEFSAAGKRVEFPELTWAVVMTSDFPSDVQALSGALPQPFPFLGVMGSPAKLAEIRRRLAEMGFGPGDLARLTAPVGLPIGSQTPEEIAISVAAQILQERPAG